MRIIFSFLFSFTLFISFSQKSITKSIKDFGAKGDGVTNDMAAFVKATEFFNLRKGQGSLIIPTGTYMVQTQTVNTKKGDKYYLNKNVLEFVKCQNLKIIGKGKVIIKFAAGQRFGSFHPQTGEVFKPLQMPFYDYAYRINLGDVINLTDCQNIQIKNIEADGNINKMIIGGTWGDVNHQVGHIGISVNRAYNVTIENVHCHHFGLDGLMIVNNERFEGKQQIRDNILIKKCNFEYNGRQGLSWVGGYGLDVLDSKFNHQGKNGMVSSQPGAGIDIEQEASPLIDGKFVNCEFINNTGPNLIADMGTSRDMLFDNCTFWGTTNWSIWVKKSNYVFKNSRFYGSIVHANEGKTDYDATKFYNCTFENKPYNGKPAYGRFLVELNNVRRMKFENSTFTAHNGVIPIWLDNSEKDSISYNIFKNCTINLNVDNTKSYEYPSVLRAVIFENTEFNISDKQDETMKKMDFHPVKSVKMRKSKIKFSDKKTIE